MYLSLSTCDLQSPVRPRRDGRLKDLAFALFGVDGRRARNPAMKQKVNSPHQADGGDSLKVNIAGELVH
jgi:hypothetical protein